MRSLIFILAVVLWVYPLHAQEDEEERVLGWSNVADLGFVVTSGNSDTSTFSFDDKLTHGWEDAEFVFRAGALRVNTSDDPVAVGTPNDFTVVDDDTRELDNERYFINGNYQRDITEKFFWIAGAGWDKDTTAGIDNRTVMYGGVGNTWIDNARTTFKTDYTLTFTHRVDAIPDPERDENFSELRLAWDFGQQLAPHSRFDSDMVFFAALQDLGDNRFANLNAVTTNLTEVFALRFGLEFRFQNIPALEEIDLVSSEGVPSGSVVIRKNSLDTVLRFSFVVTL